MRNSDKPSKPLINFRHDPKIKDLVEEKAIESNILPAAMSRIIFNAGLKNMYGIEIKGNQIVSPLDDAH